MKNGERINFQHILISGAVHRVHREAARVQQVCLEALQDHPRGRRLVRPEQRAEGHDHVSKFLKLKKKLVAQCKRDYRH